MYRPEAVDSSEESRRTLESGGGWRVVAKHYELNIGMRCMLWHKPFVSRHGSSATDGLRLSRRVTACISDYDDGSHTSRPFNCQVGRAVTCIRWCTCIAVSQPVCLLLHPVSISGRKADRCAPDGVA